MNIQDYASKIKSLYNSNKLGQKQRSNTGYFAVIMILVAISSFGIGRLSSEGDALVPVRIINPSIELGASAYSSENDGKKVRVTEPILVGSNSENIYTFVWCDLAKKVGSDDQRFFYSILEAEKAGFLPDTNCAGLR